MKQWRGTEKLLDELLTEHREKLFANQLQAFEGMREQPGDISEKQAKWIFGVGERRGLVVAPSENIFSAMSPEKQAAQRAAAARVKLPWEK